MFPLKDNVPSNTFPYVNWVIIFLNVLVFAYEMSLGGFSLQRFYLSYGIVPAEFWAPLGAVGMGDRFMPLFTSMFVHGGLLHLLGNIYFLFIFGDNIEDRLGHLRYAVIYILFGLAAALAQVLLFPGSAVPTIGASGAVAGVMGAYMIFFPHAKVKTLVFVIFFVTVIDLPAVFFLGFWFFIQFMNGTATVGATQSGGVAWWAHIGGFAAGLVYSYWFTRRRRSIRGVTLH